MTQNALDAAFSLLPKRNARFAKQHILEQANQPDCHESFKLRWAEFELGGQFVRGGISDISDMVSVIITNSQTDPYINSMARKAAKGGLSAGSVEWNKDHESFHWYLPYRFIDEKGRVSARLRGMVITVQLFGELMELFNTKANLTAAEKRTMFQLIGGEELRNAANRDNVSYETKRTHTKTACVKLGCAGQKDLIRIAMGQLVHLMSVNDTETRQVDPSVEFCETYLHEDLQLVVRHSRTGIRLRYLVGGPVGGRPAIMVHGMMFPVALRGISPHLERHNIRLYVPIRPGYLESRSINGLFQSGDLLDQSLNEIAKVIAEEELAPIALIGSSLGANAALRLAIRYPELFTHLTMLSANLARPPAKVDENSASFYQGMQDLKSNELLFKLVNLEYRKFYSDAATCRHILRAHFSNSPVDLKVLDGHYSRFPAYEMFASAYKSSIIGITEDFRLAMTGERPDVEKLKMPLAIIHGDQDPLTSFNQVRQEFNAPNKGIYLLVKGAGHFASSSHGDDVWRTVAEACSS